MNSNYIACSIYILFHKYEVKSYHFNLKIKNMLFEITDLSSVYVGMKLIKTNYQIAYFTY